MQYKGAVKIYMVLDYKGCIPHFTSITNGKVHESKMAKLVHFPSGSVVVFDWGYVDYKWLHVLDSSVFNYSDYYTNIPIIGHSEEFVLNYFTKRLIIFLILSLVTQEAKRIKHLIGVI